MPGGSDKAGGEPGGRVVGFVTSPPARRISGRGVVRWTGRSTLVPVLCVPKFCRVFQTDIKYAINPPLVGLGLTPGEIAVLVEMPFLAPTVNCQLGLGAQRRRADSAGYAGPIGDQTQPN